MGRKHRVRLRTLRDAFARAHPAVEDPESAITDGNVLVNGIAVTNPHSRVREDAVIELRAEKHLRGEAKLAAALAAFPIDVRERVALDVGAAAGGFTRALLDSGARRVYAVDAGFGQLVGSLRQDARVVNLEATNLGELGPALVPETIDLVTIDVSFLALADAVPQLERVNLGLAAEAIALVKPQFELGLAAPPSDAATLSAAVERASRAFRHARWDVHGWVESPVRGRRGAVEFLIHAGRCTGP